MASPPGIPIDPGADTAQNAARRQPVRAVTMHRTTGFWAGDYTVGKNRLHSSPGTFNWLVGQKPGQWVEFYPAEVRCSHAAGANQSGPGIEFSGQNGEPLTAWQIDAGGRIVRWLVDTYRLPRSYYWTGQRIAVDGTSFTGFVAHRSVATAPVYQHSDYIEGAEFAAMLPAPTPEEDPPVGFLCFHPDHPNDQAWVYFCRAEKRTRLTTNRPLVVQELINLRQIASVNPFNVARETFALYRDQSAV